MKPKWDFGLDKLKKINKTYLLVAALFGILLLVLAIPTEEGGKEGRDTGTQELAADTSKSSGSQEAYRKSLERQLEQTLEAMEGVGKTEVMITLKDDGEAVVEKDLTRTEERTKEEDGQGTSRENTAISYQEETLYTRDGGQEETPFVVKELHPRVEGVLVVAEGAENAVTVKNISDAILALFSVEAHKIKVVKMN